MEREGRLELAEIARPGRRETAVGLRGNGADPAEAIRRTDRVAVRKRDRPPRPRIWRVPLERGRQLPAATDRCHRPGQHLHRRDPEPDSSTERGEALLCGRAGAGRITELGVDVCCPGTDRDHGLGVLGPPNVLECEIGVERRTLAVAPAEPDQRPADVALAGQVVRRAGFDLGDERVRGRKGGVPVPELVLGDNGDSAEPTREARLPVVLGLSSCLTPESKTFAQITALSSERRRGSPCPGRCRTEHSRPWRRPRRARSAPARRFPRGWSWTSRC